jgi:hypothetical protein
MTLEEIKAAIVERIDTAWNEVKDKVDADQVRTYVQGLTAELTSHVYAVEAALVNHVLGKQDPTPAPAASDPAPAATEQPATDPAPAATAPAPAEQTPAADTSVPANPTGMASNPPAADPAGTTPAA